MTERKRKQDYVVSDRSEAFADLLFEIVNRLDTGTPAYQLSEQVRALSILMDQGNL